MVLEGQRRFWESQSAAEVAAVLPGGFALSSFVDVSWPVNGISLGEVLIWMSGPRARLRLDEHREHFAHDPALSYDIAVPEVEFTDEDELNFTWPVHHPVTRDQARQALMHWLASGEQAPRSSTGPDYGSGQRMVPDWSVRQTRTPES